MDRVEYELLCPCGYGYYVSVFDEPEWEICPLCGLGMPFKMFIIGEETGICSRLPEIVMREIYRKPLSLIHLKPWSLTHPVD